MRPGRTATRRGCGWSCGARRGSHPHPEQFAADAVRFACHVLLLRPRSWKPRLRRCRHGGNHHRLPRAGTPKQARPPYPGLVAGEAYRELGEAAWAWVLGQVRGDEGPWLPEAVPVDEPPGGPGADRDSVYAGIGGLAPVLAEIGQYRPLTGAEQALADAIVARLCSVVPAHTEP